MKFLVILTVLFTSSAFASRPDDFEITRAEREVKGATFAEMALYSVVQQCANQPKCRSKDMGLVTITFNLKNCGDQLGELAYKFDDVANKLYVSAINLETAPKIVCVRQSTKEVQFTVGGADENTEVINLGE